MSYNPTNWVNGETPINDSNLNHIEQGIKDVADLADSHENKIADIANNQIPEAYLQQSVDNYIANNQAGLATKTNLSELDSKISGEIADTNKQIGSLGNSVFNAISDEINDRNIAISSAVDAEKARAMKRENEIEELFTAPTQEAIDKWLSEHPEATTTVQDKSITLNKLAIGTLSYVMPEMFGAKGDGITDDTNAILSCLESGREKGINVFYFTKKYKITPPLNIKSNETIRGGEFIVDSQPPETIKSGVINPIFTTENASNVVFENVTAKSTGLIYKPALNSDNSNDNALDSNVTFLYAENSEVTIDTCTTFDMMMLHCYETNVVLVNNKALNCSMFIRGNANYTCRSNYILLPDSGIVKFYHVYYTTENSVLNAEGNVVEYNGTETPWFDILHAFTSTSDSSLYHQEIHLKDERYFGNITALSQSKYCDIEMDNVVYDSSNTNTGVSFMHNKPNNNGMNVYAKNCTFTMYDVTTDTGSNVNSTYGDDNNIIFENCCFNIKTYRYSLRGNAKYYKCTFDITETTNASRLFNDNTHIEDCIFNLAKISTLLNNVAAENIVVVNNIFNMSDVPYTKDIVVGSYDTLVITGNVFKNVLDNTLIAGGDNVYVAGGKTYSNASLDIDKINNNIFKKIIKSETFNLKNKSGLIILSHVSATGKNGLYSFASNDTTLNLTPIKETTEVSLVVNGTDLTISTGTGSVLVNMIMG